jgi:hypothetical protein
MGKSGDYPAERTLPWPAIFDHRRDGEPVPPERGNNVHARSDRREQIAYAGEHWLATEEDARFVFAETRAAAAGHDICRDRFRPEAFRGL